MVLLRCRNRRRLNGIVGIVNTINFSLNVKSPTSNYNSTVAVGGLGWKCGNGDASGKGGFTVHKSNIVCRSASDTCQSVIKSSLSIGSLGSL